MSERGIVFELFLELYDLPLQRIKQGQKYARD